MFKNNTIKYAGTIIKYHPLPNYFSFTVFKEHPNKTISIILTGDFILSKQTQVLYNGSQNRIRSIVILDTGKYTLIPFYLIEEEINHKLPAIAKAIARKGGIYQ